MEAGAVALAQEAVVPARGAGTGAPLLATRVIPAGVGAAVTYLRR